MDTLINTKTNNTISSDDIYSSSNNGIVITNKNCWKYIPASEIKTQTNYDDKVYYKYEDPVDINITTKVQDYHTKENPITSYYVEKASCKFGFTGLEIGTQNINKSCSVISNYINLKSYSYITISSTINNLEDWITEFYILDGVNEVPVLNIEKNNVAIKEKLFYMLPTLFSIDNTLNESVLYQDGKIISKNYLDLSHEDFINHEYILEYFPIGENIKYIPENQQIRIKMILRYIGQNEPKISNNSYCSVVINKHGGKAEWN